MRWMCWLAVLPAVCVLGGAAVAFQPAGGCPSCNGVHGTITAPACCFSGFGLSPGCCEWRPSWCDRVWDTYCAGKAYRLQRHYMREATHPLPVPYAQPGWYGPAAMMQPTGAWSGETVVPVPAEAPLPDAPMPVPLPDASDESES